MSSLQLIANLPFGLIILEEKIVKIKSDTAPKSRKDELVVQELDGEVLIYDLRTNKAFCLNPTSALVWQFCDGNKSVAEIRNLVGEKLNSTVSEDLVWLALDQLKKEKLIENGSEIENRFEGMSRREVIKKIGLTSVVALPIVASLIAPTAALAQASCNNMSCDCTGPQTGTNCPSTTCAVGCTCRGVNPQGMNGNCQL